MRGLMALVLLSLTCVPLYAHSLGERTQWQPRTAAADPRLGQAVTVEILGRSTTAALEVLSEQTGVSLGVAPEDVNTVGQRKVTIIAQGLSLKGIMVQLPEALQECHWDVDPAGPAPVYLLHRHGDTESAMVQAMKEEPRCVAEAARPARLARVEAARAALAMSPEELAELAKTDPLLAAAARDSLRRTLMEAFFLLPGDKMDEFLSTGETRMALKDTALPVRMAVSALVQSKLEKLERENAEGRKRGMLQGFIDWYAGMLEEPGNIGIVCMDLSSSLGIGGIQLSICADARAEGMHSDNDFIPPRAVDKMFGEHVYRDALIEMAGSAAAADAMLANLMEQYDAAVAAHRERTRKLEWREPTRPELRRTVTLPFQGWTEPLEIQRFIAKESGLSIVSDYFATWSPKEIPAEAKTEQPLWRLLYLLGEEGIGRHGRHWSWVYEWDQRGSCLVFHDRAWYRRAPGECLESLFETYREKLAEQGGFTLDDAAAFFDALDRLRPSHPQLQRALPRVPRELAKAGLWDQASGGPALRLYASLALGQRLKARSAAGLPYDEMTPEQQELVLRSSTSGRDKHPLPEGEISRATFRVAGSGSTSTLIVAFPSRTVELTLDLPLPAFGGPE